MSSAAIGVRPRGQLNEGGEAKRCSDGSRRRHRVAMDGAARRVVILSQPHLRIEVFITKRHTGDTKPFVVGERYMYYTSDNEEGLPSVAFGTAFSLIWVVIFF